MYFFQIETTSLKLASAKCCFADMSHFLILLAISISCCDVSKSTLQISERYILTESFEISDKSIFFITGSSSSSVSSSHSQLVSSFSIWAISSSVGHSSAFSSSDSSDWLCSSNFLSSAFFCCSFSNSSFSFNNFDFFFFLVFLHRQYKAFI